MKIDKKISETLTAALEIAACVVVLCVVAFLL